MKTFEDLYSEFYGVDIDKAEQITFYSYSGTELKEFVNYCIEQAGSESAKVAAVGNGADGKGVCGGTECDHPYYSVHGDLDTCLKCGKILGG